MNNRRTFLTFLAVASGGALWASVSGAKQTPQTPPAAAPPLWTDDERKAIVAYWNAPKRYVIDDKPADSNITVPGSLPAFTFFHSKANLYVNITVAGSEWYWKYTHVLPDVKKTDPARAAQWEAAFEAQLASELQGKQEEQKQRTETGGFTGSILLPILPEDLQKAVGPEPLDFYDVVQPMRYTVTFAPEDGPATPFVYTDNLDFTKPKPYYAYYRSTNGVRKFGTRLKAMTEPQKADVNALFASVASKPFEQHVLAAVSALEGGFEAVNTYDTGWVSIGFIQFITKIDGTGSLASVLGTHKKNDPADFTQTFHRFGIDVDASGIVSVCDPQTGNEYHGSDAVGSIIRDKRLTAVFERAGSLPGFRKAQVQVARQQYWPGDDTITVVRQTLSEQKGGETKPTTKGVFYAALENAQAFPPEIQAALAAQTDKQKADPDYSVTVETKVLSAKVSDIVKSEAGMATLMDRKVNRGNLGAINETVAQIMQTNQLTNLKDAARYEKTLMAAMKYRADYLSDPALTQPPNPPAPPK